MRRYKGWGTNGRSVGGGRRGGGGFVVDGKAFDDGAALSVESYEFTWAPFWRNLIMTLSRALIAVVS